MARNEMTGGSPSDWLFFPGEGPSSPGGRLTIHAAAIAGVVVLLTAVWAATSRGFFWPIQALLPLAVTLAIHGWIVLLGERPRIRERLLGSEALAIHVGVAASLWLYLFGLWAVGDSGYFWPVWALLGLAALVGVHALQIARRPQV
jgi:hypothetical protein